jgi:hypothetical protein
MIAILACLLSGPGEVPIRLTADESGNETFLRLRGGVWAGRGFAFETIRTDSTQVKNDDEVLPAAGLDLGFIFAEKFLLLISADYAATDHVTVPAAGAAIGYLERRRPDAARGVPDEVAVYAGGFWSSFEVDASGFGDFDDAIGFRAGLALTWRPSSGVAVGAVGEYRLVEYDYEGDVLMGDRQAGGSTGWLGATLDLRF